jgi:ATP-dependent RNA helicase DDX27
VEILIMDEADRMLEEGFAAELNEIVQATPKGRQTMLFSATMTDDVDELVRLSLRRPVRLFVDPKRTTAAKLIQEFVRVRGSGSAGSAAELTAGSSSSAGGRRTEDEARPALLLSLCTRTFRHQVIIFVRSKKLAHQLKIVFGLVGLSAAELHGDLSQEQRLLALQNFRDGKVDFLIATDLASRGLDIRGVQTVINYDMPAQFEQYLHRVGRTARAGRNGR